MATYHAYIGLPNIPTPSFLNLTYSRHAREQAAKRGIRGLPDSLKVLKGDLLELYVEGGVPVKALYRQDHTATHDINLLVNLLTGHVISVWLNHYQDLHATLDRSRYTVP